MGNHIYTTKKPYTFNDILQCSQLCASLTDQLNQDCYTSTLPISHCEVQHCANINKSSMCCCPLQKACASCNLNHHLQAFKLCYNSTHYISAGNTNVAITHTLRQTRSRQTQVEQNAAVTVPKITSKVPQSKAQSRYTWHEHQPRTSPSRIKCEPVQLSRDSVFVKANEVYVLIHIQRKDNTLYLPNNQQVEKLKTTKLKDQTQTKQSSYKYPQQQHQQTDSHELPQPLPSSQQAQHSMHDCRTCKCQQEIIPAWATKISLLFTPRGVRRPFASDIQKPRANTTTYSTSYSTSTASLPPSSACVQGRTTLSCQGNVNCFAKVKSKRQLRALVDDNMYNAQYTYSIHILNGKHAHPLISAMAVLFANEIEKLLRVPCVLMHLYNNTLSRLLLLKQRQKQKAVSVALQKTNVDSSLFNNRGNTNCKNNRSINNKSRSAVNKNDNNRSQSMNVSALTCEYNDGKIINVQNTSHLTNSVCDGVNQSAMRIACSAFPCSITQQQSNLISRNMLSARSMSTLTTSFPFQQSANTFSAKTQKQTPLPNKSMTTTPPNIKTHWLQLVPVGTIVCEGDEDNDNNSDDDDHDNESISIIKPLNKVQFVHTCNANTPKRANKKAKNNDKRRQATANSIQYRNKLHTRASLTSPHTRQVSQRHRRRPCRSKKGQTSQTVCEQQPRRMAGSSPCVQSSTILSTSPSMQAYSSRCNSTASLLLQPPLPPPPLPPSSSTSTTARTTNSLEPYVLHRNTQSETNQNGRVLNYTDKHPQRARMGEYARNALLRILTNQYTQQSQIKAGKLNAEKEHLCGGDNVIDQDNTSRTMFTPATSRAASLLTNQSLLPQPVRTSATATASAVVFNSVPALSPGAENDNSISLTSPRMIIYGTPRSLVDKHVKTSHKASQNRSAVKFEKANFCCTRNHNNDNNISSNSGSGSNNSSTYQTDKDSVMNCQHTSKSSKVQSGREGVPRVQGPPTLHLCQGADALTPLYSKVDKQHMQQQDNQQQQQQKQITSTRTGQNRYTVLANSNRTQLQHSNPCTCTNNTVNNNDSINHFKSQTNDLQNTSMTAVTGNTTTNKGNHEISTNEGNENYYRDNMDKDVPENKNFVQKRTVTGYSNTEVKEPTSQGKADREVYTSVMQRGQQVKTHDENSKGDRNNKDDVQDEDDEVRMTDDRIRKWRFASVTATQVLPYLFVGGELPAKNKHLLLHLGITTIVNTLSYEIPNAFPTLFYYDNLYVSDSPDEPIFALFPHIIRVIEDEVQNTDNGKVYIHCHQGVSRSCTFVIAYLMWKNNWDYLTAYNFVRDRRNVCNPNAGFQLNLRLWRAHLQSVYLRCGFAFLPYSDEYPLPFVYQFAIIFDVQEIDEQNGNISNTNKNAENKFITYVNARSEEAPMQITLQNTEHGTIASTQHDITPTKNNCSYDNYTTRIDNSQTQKEDDTVIQVRRKKMSVEPKVDQTVTLARPLIERNAQRVSKGHPQYTLNSQICYGFVFKTPARTRTFMYCNNSIHPSIRERAIQQWNYFVRFGIGASTEMQKNISATAGTNTKVSSQNAVLETEKDVRQLISSQLGWIWALTAGIRNSSSQCNDNRQNNKNWNAAQSISTSSITNQVNKLNSNNQLNNCLSCPGSDSNINCGTNTGNYKNVACDSITSNHNTGNMPKSYKKALETLQNYILQQKDKLYNRDRQRRTREEFNMSSSMLTASSTSVNDMKDRLFAPNRNVLISAKDFNDQVIHNKQAHTDERKSVSSGLQQSCGAAPHTYSTNTKIQPEATNLQFEAGQVRNTEQQDNRVQTIEMCNKEVNTVASVQFGNNSNDSNNKNCKNQNTELALLPNIQNQHLMLKHRQQGNAENLCQNYQSDGSLIPQQQHTLHSGYWSDTRNDVINEIQVFEYPFTLPAVHGLTSINDLKSSKSYLIYLPAFGQLSPSKARVFVWVGQCCNVNEHKAYQTFVQNCCVDHKTKSKTVYSAITHSINKLIKNSQGNVMAQDSMESLNPSLQRTCTVQLPSGVKLHNVNSRVIREGEQPDDLLLLFD